MLEPKTSLFSPVQSVTSRKDYITSFASPKRDIDAAHVDNDEDLLAEIGYKQELLRKFSTFQIFGISYSIMGILPSIASVLGTALTAGPAGATWSWVIASVFILTVGLAMSELASAIPTSGGLYYWTFYYAPANWKVPISYLIGLSNTLALTSGCVSVFYGNAEEILAAVYLTFDGNFEITTGKTYGIFVGCFITGAIATCVSSRNVALLQTISSVSHTGIFLLYIIALPIGTKINRGEFNDGKYIFGTVQNYSDWPIGWQFCLSLMAAVWTIGSFDSCVHMSEEAKNASYGVPIGITSSIATCGILGWVIILVTTACMTKDVQSLLDSPTGFPMAQVIYDSLGRRWSIAFMALMAVCQWLMGTSLVTAVSRQIWAFSRDDGMPFSSIIKVVDQKVKVPIRAIIFSCIIGLALGCLCLAGSTASSALFSLGVCGNYLAWCTPIFLRLTSGRNRFKPGVFYLGKFWSELNGWVCCIWGFFIILIACFPSTTTVTADTMNYCVVISGGVWILSLVFFYSYKFKYYHGPKSTINDADVIASSASSTEVINIDGQMKEEKEV